MPLLPLLVASAAMLPSGGLWEYQSSLGGMAGKSEQRCLTEAEVRHFLTDPSNRHYACDMTTREVGDGRVRLKGVCTSRKHPEQKVGVTLGGGYTAGTIDLKGQGSARVIGDLELPVSISVSAHRVAADCAAAPPEAAARSGAGPG